MVCHLFVKEWEYELNMFLIYLITITLQSKFDYFDTAVKKTNLIIRE